MEEKGEKKRRKIRIWVFKKILGKRERKKYINGENERECLKERDIENGNGSERLGESKKSSPDQ